MVTTTFRAGGDERRRLLQEARPVVGIDTRNPESDLVVLRRLDGG